MTTTVRSLCLIAFGTSLAMAHDMRLHRGKPTDGVVSAIAADHLTLEAEGRSITVVIDAETRIERGDESVGRDQVAVGSHAAVLGTKLPTGELVAREIHLHATGERSQPLPTGSPGRPDRDGRH